MKTLYKSRIRNEEEYFDVYVVADNLGDLEIVVNANYPEYTIEKLERIEEEVIL